MSLSVEDLAARTPKSPQNYGKRSRPRVLRPKSTTNSCRVFLLFSSLILPQNGLIFKKPLKVRQKTPPPRKTVFQGVISFFMSVGVRNIAQISSKRECGAIQCGDSGNKLNPIALCLALSSPNIGGLARPSELSAVVAQNQRFAGAIPAFASTLQVSLIFYQQQSLTSVQTWGMLRENQTRTHLMATISCHLVHPTYWWGQQWIRTGDPAEIVRLSTEKGGFPPGRRPCPLRENGGGESNQSVKGSLLQNGFCMNFAISRQKLLTEKHTKKRTEKRTEKRNVFAEFSTFLFLEFVTLQEEQ